MWIETYFESSGIPATSLSPTIRIRDVENGTVVVSGSMIEIDEGLYKYNFIEYDITKDYCILCDALSLPNADRYKFLTTEGLGSSVNTLNILNENINSRTDIVRKILTNKLILMDGAVNNWVLYDDDDTSGLLMWDVSDKSGTAISQQKNQVSGRTRGV